MSVSIYFSSKIYFYFVCKYFCLHVCMCISGTPGAHEGQRREHQTLWNWSYRQSCAATWMLGPLQELPMFLVTELWPLFLLLVGLGMESIASSMP